MNRIYTHTTMTARRQTLSARWAVAGTTRFLINRLMNTIQKSLLRSALVFAALILSASFAVAGDTDPIPGVDVNLVNADGKIIKTEKKATENDD